MCRIIDGNIIIIACIPINREIKGFWEEWRARKKTGKSRSKESKKIKRQIPLF